MSCDISIRSPLPIGNGLSSGPLAGFPQISSRSLFENSPFVAWQIAGENSTCREASFGVITYSGRFASIVLKPGIDGFALKGENTENAFVNAAKRLLSNEAFQCFNAKSKFAERQQAFGRDRAATEAI
jgi:hypothetical protein